MTEGEPVKPGPSAGGKQKKKKRSKPAKKPVELGYAEPVESGWKHLVTSSFFPSKIGGFPAWLALEPLLTGEKVGCRSCHNPCAFLLQVYAPDAAHDHSFHRTLFVFVCRNPACYRTKNTSLPVRVFRSQLARTNRFYGYDPIDPDFYDPLKELWNPAWKYAKLCTVCGCKGEKCCGSCKFVTYCSKDHQQFHWRAKHKSKCHHQSTVPSNSNNPNSSEHAAAAIVKDVEQMNVSDRLPSVNGNPTLTRDLEGSGITADGLSAGKIGADTEADGAETVDEGLDCRDDPSGASSTPQTVDGDSGEAAQSVHRDSARFKDDVSVNHRVDLWNVEDGNDFLFPELELITEPEIYHSADKATERAEKDRMKEYEEFVKEKGAHFVESSKETLESLDDMCEERTDKCFEAFTERVASNPDQVLRYDRGGTPLLCSDSVNLDVVLGVEMKGGVTPRLVEEKKQKSGVAKADPKSASPNTCDLCGGQRTFEFQIMPHLLSLLGVDIIGESIDWGTILVFTCAGSCPLTSESMVPSSEDGDIEGNHCGYVEEWAIKCDFGDIECVGGQ